MNHNMMQLQRETKYKSARVSLLLILVCSLINIFSLTFANTYFLFSAYFPAILASFGAFYYAEGATSLFVIFALLALVSLVPYLLCYLFSKKHPGWMIAALVLFSVDSLLLLVDFVPALLSGDLSSIIDMAFHAYAIFCLAYAVKCGMDKNAAPEMPVPPAAPLTVAVGEEPTESALDEAATSVRRIVITRKKSFVDCAIKHRCFIDGNEIGLLANGASIELMTSGVSHEMMIMAPDGSAVTATVPAGGENHCYVLSIKMGAIASKLILEEIPATNM